jgi:hypothetical protein
MVANLFSLLEAEPILKYCSLHIKDKLNLSPAAHAEFIQYENFLSAYQPPDMNVDVAIQKLQEMRGNEKISAAQNLSFFGNLLTQDHKITITDFLLAEFTSRDENKDDDFTILSCINKIVDFIPAAKIAELMEILKNRLNSDNPNKVIMRPLDPLRTRLRFLADVTQQIPIKVKLCYDIFGSRLIIYNSYCA